MAEALIERLQGACKVEIVEIVPTRKRSYLHWLAYSFIPNSEVEIENPQMRLSAYNGVILGFPKWTLSCPPLNKFIRKLSALDVPKFFLFMTYGGFDEERFLRSFIRKLAEMRVNVVESVAIKREEILTETYKASVDVFGKLIGERLGLLG